jgi:hypothetical protein
MQDRSDRVRVGWYRARINEVLLPRFTRISQSFVNVFFGPLPQIFDLGVYDDTWELAHILLQPLAHKFEATRQKFGVMVRRIYVKSLVGAPGWINDEVGEGFVEGSDRVINVLLEDEERVHGREEGGHLFGIEAQERRNSGWRKGVRSENKAPRTERILGSSSGSSSPKAS